MFFGIDEIIGVIWMVVKIDCENVFFGFICDIF